MDGFSKEQEGIRRVDIFSIIGMCDQIPFTLPLLIYFNSPSSSSSYLHNPFFVILWRCISLIGAFFCGFLINQNSLIFLSFFSIQKLQSNLTLFISSLTFFFIKVLVDSVNYLTFTH